MGSSSTVVRMGCSSTVVRMGPVARCYCSPILNHRGLEWDAVARWLEWDAVAPVVRMGLQSHS